MNSHPAIENTRRQLGELGAMAAKTETAERDILERAQKRLADIESGLEQRRARAMTDDAAAAEYADLIEERGRLQLVIAQAREALSEIE